MKAILFFFIAFISLNVSAAPIEIHQGQFSHPDLDGGGGCSIFGCSGSIYNPITDEGYNDTGEPQPDTETYFWSGIDRVDRNMEMSFSGYVIDSVAGMLTWSSGGLYNGGVLNVFGFLIDLGINPSGSHYLPLLGGQGASTYISVQANSVDAFVRWDLVFGEPPPAVSEVPIPASLFLFAPALLGFIGLRRKTKLS